jgi:hypothetical protein
MEARAGLVPASVFKTDDALREQRHGGFDSHALPRLLGGSQQIRRFWPPFCHEPRRIEQAHGIARDFWREMRVAHRHLDPG